MAHLAVAEYAVERVAEIKVVKRQPAEILASFLRSAQELERVVARRGSGHITADSSAETGESSGSALTSPEKP